MSAISKLLLEREVVQAAIFSPTAMKTTFIVSIVGYIVWRRDNPVI